MVQYSHEKSKALSPTYKPNKSAQRSNKSIEPTKRVQHSCQWFASKGIYTEHAGVEVELLNCGKKAFSAIYEAIYYAKKSVEIVMWGFDPNMRFNPDTDFKIRNFECSIDDDLTIGELLEQKAREGVQCKVLVWYSFIASVFSESTVVGMGGDGSGNNKESTTDYSNDIKRRDQLSRDKDKALARRAELDQKKRLNNETLSNEEEQERQQLDGEISKLGAEIAIINKRVAGYGQRSNSGAGKAYPEDQKKARDWIDRARGGQIPNLEFETRGFTALEHAAIGVEIKRIGGSLPIAVAVGAIPSHHQKLVLVDYEDPKNAVAFVMGHNMHRAYWDTPEHYFYDYDANRPSEFGPWQDISTKVKGTILYDINDNIVKAWLRERKGATAFKAHRETIQSDEFSTNGTQMAQFCRTQMQESNDQTILEVYQKAIGNAHNYIYMENQYLRYAQLIEKIVARAKQLRSSTEEHGVSPPDLYFFVITNNPNDRTFSSSTYDTLKVLGQQQLMPEVQRTAYHKRGILYYLNPFNWFRADPLSSADKEHIEDIKTKEDIERMSQDADTVRQNAERRGETVDESKLYDVDGESGRKPFELEEREGLKVIIGTLTSDSFTQRNTAGAITQTRYDIYRMQHEVQYRDIYIHSKLLVVDDLLTFVGSANINVRSFAGDSESGIAVPDIELAYSTRSELWTSHAKESFDASSTNASAATQCNAEKNYEHWNKMMNRNWKNKGKGIKLDCQLTRFWDVETPYARAVD